MSTTLQAGQRVKLTWPISGLEGADVIYTITSIATDLGFPLVRLVPAAMPQTDDDRRIAKRIARLQLSPGMLTAVDDMDDQKTLERS